MPNTPGQIGHGMTVWTATDAVDETGRRQAQAILGALGKELYVGDEGYLDMATALSGTGPAYVFLFMEALIDAGVHMGFSRRVAQELVYQTIEGSVAIARETGLHPTELRNRVTSPGGTIRRGALPVGEGRPAHRHLEGRVGGVPEIQSSGGVGGEVNYALSTSSARSSRSSAF